ncbi:hypothetical protein [Sphingomonas lenta]|uniref:Uncharacterized protein n=1 Tax=Sphingomonas lenta TaxID=1141887 RepID=A0A2A2SAV9_9SPHN|nr:hypothetical protein [Sphingomonas lenta]PAX06388.1 hypothetical protein CKY28_17455 [Sphingomonas lenta]
MAGQGDPALSRAQDLMYDAWDADGPERVALARQALAISPLCADAYVLLADEAADTDEEAVALYQRGVEAGELAIGSGFEERRGEFWGWLETRPYMRARAGLAGTLYRVGEVAQALDHWREMLELNPDDNQGVRHLLAFGLLRSGRSDELRALLRRYRDDGGTAMSYTRALVAFRDAAGNAAELGAEAVAANGYLPAMLSGAARPDPSLDGYVTMGGSDEASWYVDEAGDVWRRTPGAIEWLLETAAATGPKRGRRG